MTIPAIAPIGEASATPIALQLGGTSAAQPAPASFGNLLINGLQNVDTKVADADKLVRQFALGDDIPVHQVTIALEQARLSVELAMQVRARLVESYRDLMNMQL